MQVPDHDGLDHCFSPPDEDAYCYGSKMYVPANFLLYAGREVGVMSGIAIHNPL